MPNFLKKMFTGRMNRKQFLLPGLFFVVLPIPLAVSSFLLAGVEVGFIIPISVSSLILLLFAAPTIRRLHDVGLSGWFSLILFLTIPATLYLYSILIFLLLGESLYAAAQDHPLLSLVLIVSSLINIFSILFLLLKSSDEKNNKYGTKPIYQKNRIFYWAVFTLTSIGIISLIIFLRVFLSGGIPIV